MNATVQLDGKPFGADNAPGAFPYQVWNNTVVFDSGVYHMWYQSTEEGWMRDIKRATSTDGVNFTTAAGSELQPGTNWWAQSFNGSTATSEPRASFIRVAKLGSEWVLMVWSGNTATYGPYAYNTTLWRIGADITNTALAMIGPLPFPNGPGRNHIGATGIVNDHLYLVHGDGGSLGRYQLNGLASPPLTSPAALQSPPSADLFTGTPWCRSVAASCYSLVHNQARTLDQNGVLGSYFAFRVRNANGSVGVRRDKQLYYAESADNGLTWSATTGVFANGDAVTVDGLLTTQQGFGYPDVVNLGGGAFRGYFSVANACGKYVMVTAAPAAGTSGLRLAKTFAPQIVPVGGTSALTITLSVPAASCTPAPAGAQYTGIGFTDHLPDGLTVASVGANTCGGTLTAAAGGNTVNVSGVSLNAGQSCTATVNLSVNRAGAFTNTIFASAAAGPGGVTNAQQVPAVSTARATLRTPGLAATAVPGLGPWSLVLLSVLAGACGALRLRSRHA